MAIKELQSFLREIPVFSIYEDQELAELLQNLKLMSLNAGEVVFRQGDVGDNFYIVYSGRIRILQKNEQDKEVNLGIVSKGDLFGETALIIAEWARNTSLRRSR